MTATNLPAEFWQGVDWDRIWLAPLRGQAERLLSDNEGWRNALNQRVRERRIANHHRQPIEFVPQSSLPAGLSYEAFISATGKVPTRDNLHDFFNGLVWLQFPLIKARLNALQADDLAASSCCSSDASVPMSRTRLRDALTLFDENALLLATSDADVIAALRAQDWNTLLVSRRSAFNAACMPIVFGHALLEKLVTPYKAITAHVWVILVAPSFFELALPARISQLDVVVSESLSANLRSSDFAPLPVLGIPGWWPDQSAAFYADAQVFRAKRLHLPRDAK